MLSNTFKENYRALKKNLGIADDKPCLCGKTTDNHCRAFPDNVWFGCLRPIRINAEEKQDKE